MAVRFRWMSGIFGGLGLFGLAAIAALSFYGVQKDVDIYQDTPAITAWLFNWPEGFRTLIVATVAALLTALGLAAIGALDQAAVQSGWRRWPNFTVRLLLAAGICGVLYVLAIFGTALAHYGAGLWNLAWLIGVPLALGFFLHPRWSGILLVFAVSPLGLLVFAAICRSFQIDVY